MSCRTSGGSSGSLTSPTDAPKPHAPRLTSRRGAESLPCSGAGALSVPERDPAIHHDHGDSLGILERILEAGPVDHRGRVEYHQIRRAPHRDFPAVRETQPPGPPPGHLVDRTLEGEHFTVPHVL